MFMLFVDHLEFFKLALFAAEDLHDVHARNMLLHERVEVSHRVTHIVESDLYLLFKNVRADQQQWNGRQAEQGQPPILVEHETENENDLEEIACHGGNTFAKDIGQGFDVGNGTGYQSADGSFIEKS